MTDPTALLELLLPGDSEMAGRMRAFDWPASALGPTSQWPENLRVAVRLCLTSCFPTCLWWGPELLFLHNDAFLPLLSDARRSQALMQPGREVWREVWDTLAPMLDGVIASGDARWAENTELHYDRRLREEVYITWSFAPILAADGHTVEGIFSPCSETTEAIMAARRLETPRGPDIRTGDARPVTLARVQDITNRKIAEDRLAESERRFRLLAESIPHHVWSFRLDPNDLPGSTFGYWNQRLIEYTGLTEGERRPGGWKALHPDDVERVEAAWKLASAQGTDYEMEQRVRGRDGRYRRFLCRAVAVKDERGQIVEWFGTNTDVEDRRQTEEALHNLQAEFAHVMRVTMLGELAASIAHEVNQPLAAVVANGGACLRWLTGSASNLPEARAAAERIVRDGTRAAGVITRIRGFLKRGTANVAAIDLGDVVSDVLAMAQREIHANSVTVRVTAASDLPQAAADRTQLQQVVLNLVINAIEAMSTIVDRARTVDIDLRRQAPDMLSVAVRDSGVGLPDNQRDRIFDPFHSTKPHGMGLGLAISRSIIEAHGGRLWATGSPSHGAIFRFTLPVAVHR